MNKKILEIKNLCKKFKDLKVLDNINISISEGEWIAIMGPSGSGKTTLLNILSLMDTLSEGKFKLSGENASKLNEEEKNIIRREKIGLIFQQFHLIPYLNALENVMLAQYYHSIIDEEQAIISLKKVGLSHRTKHLPSELSGGEQQRVCIARALINDPKIILADEPTGNLDSKNETIVLEIFKTLKKEGKTIVLISHNLELAKNADRIIKIKHGKIEI